MLAVFGHVMNSPLPYTHTYIEIKLLEAQHFWRIIWLFDHSLMDILFDLVIQLMGNSVTQMLVNMH